MVQRGEQRGADVDIEGADILVAGGRGLGKAENFKLAEDLADAFGGNTAVAATRAVVDAGWYPYAAQIGQTGKTVSPKLYLAAGISGAIQHKVGMQSSENIVAINKDANAPIFEFSDLGHRRRSEQDPAQADRRDQGEEGFVAMASRNGHGPHAPSEFPPPVDSVGEFVKRGLDPEDELIEVGVAIVGGGTAGLACANRLLQLLGDDPELMEKLGRGAGGGDREGEDVRRAQPLGRGDAARAAAGAVPGAEPGGLAQGALRLRRGDQGVGLHAHRPQDQAPGPDPAVPNFKNHGNEVVSVAALARYQQRQAEEGGAYVLTETSATQLIVEDGKVVGVRSGDKGRGKDGEPLRQLRARHRHQGPGHRARPRAAGAISPARRSRSSTSAEGREPQVWELGVKEVWKVPKPLDRVIHTFVQPWPLKVAAKYGQLGGTWLYPMKDEKTGDDLVSIGFVVDLNYRDATTSAHDLLQAVQDPPAGQGHPRRRRAGRWGAKALPGGGYWSMPKLSMPGALLVGDAGGMVDTAALKGVHHCIKSGILAAEAIYANLKGGEPLRAYEEAVEQSSIGTGALPGAQHPPGVPEGLHRRQPAGRPVDHVQGQAAAGPAGVAPRRRASRCSSATRASAIPSPTASTSSTSSRVGLHLRQRDARRRAQPHPVAQERAAGDRRDLALDVPGRRVRDPRRRAGDGHRST